MDGSILLRVRLSSARLRHSRSDVRGNYNRTKLLPAMLRRYIREHECANACTFQSTLSVISFSLSSSPSPLISIELFKIISIIFAFDKSLFICKMSSKNPLISITIFNMIFWCDLDIIFDTISDYRWWWRSLLTSGSTALYVFLYSIGTHAYTRMHSYMHAYHTSVFFFMYLFPPFLPFNILFFPNPFFAALFLPSVFSLFIPNIFFSSPLL